MSRPADITEIARRLKGDIFAGGTRALVPGPGHSAADRSLSLWLSGSRVVWHSFAGDSPADVFKHLGLEQIAEASPEERAQAERERRQEEARRLAMAWRFCEAVWSETALIDGTLVAAYLRSRGLAVPATGELRFHPRCPMNYERSRTAPAMVGVVRSADGRATGLHVTALKPDGSGKAGDRCRVMFGKVSGGAVRLAPRSQDGQLAVAEGIENALAFGEMRGLPTWATLSTSGLRAFMPPLGLSRLTVAADADKAGIAAARALAERIARRVEVLVEPPPAGDWNDALRALRVAA